MYLTLSACSESVPLRSWAAMNSIKSGVAVFEWRNRIDRFR